MAEYIEPFAPKFRGDEFGNLAPYRNGKPHRGQDWHPRKGSAIPAITNGAVKVVGWSDVLGFYLIQSTADKMYVLYAHLLEKPNLSIGHYLHSGDRIGRVGNTGSASTGAHLHLSIGKSLNLPGAVYSKLVDPLKHILENPKEKK